MPRYATTRLRRERRGFRAKLSTGWFVFDTWQRKPVAGPFARKAQADRERNAYNQRIETESVLMGPQKEPQKEQTKTSTRETKEETTDVTREAPDDRKDGARSGDGESSTSDETDTDDNN